MRKFISIVLSALMAVTMCTAAALPAFAADPVKSPTASTIPDSTTTTVPGQTTTAATIQEGKVTTTVNGDNKQGVTYTVSETNPNEVTFRYEGEGTLIGWEHNLADLGLISGTDYTAVENADGSFTITFITQPAIAQWNAGTVIVNAIVEFDEEEPTEEKEESTTKKNKSSKSPSTGASVAVVAGSIAAAGAGFAVLAASKKRDAE